MTKKPFVVILFERSGALRTRFALNGWTALSVDIVESTDYSAGTHIIDDVFKWIKYVDWRAVDLLIAHPPCTALAVSGNRYYANTPQRQSAARDIRTIWEIPVKKLCIENPVGVINTLLSEMPKPQYVQPWMFGHDASKKTGLWKRNLPDLQPTDVIIKHRYANQTKSGQNNLAPSPERANIRSVTYPGIAEAIVAQWGKI